MSLNLRAPVLDDEGRPIIAPSFVEAGHYDGCYNGFRWEITAGTTNEHDTELETDVKIQGGQYRLVGGPPADGDYMCLSVIDKNDVLGMFSLYDYEVGVDELELFRYVRNHYACSNTSCMGLVNVFEFPSAKFIPMGLFLRAIYVSIGECDIVMYGDYKWYEG